MKTWLIISLIASMLRDPIRGLAGLVVTALVVSMIFPRETAQSILALLFILGLVIAFFLAEGRKNVS